MVYGADGFLMSPNATVGSTRIIAAWGDPRNGGTIQVEPQALSISTPKAGQGFDCGFRLAIKRGFVSGESWRLDLPARVAKSTGTITWCLHRSDNQTYFSQEVPLTTQRVITSLVLSFTTTLPAESVDLQGLIGKQLQLVHVGEPVWTKISGPVPGLPVIRIAPLAGETTTTRPAPGPQPVEKSLAASEPPRAQPLSDSKVAGFLTDKQLIGLWGRDLAILDIVPDTTPSTYRWRWTVSELVTNQFKVGQSFRFAKDFTAGRRYLLNLPVRAMGTRKSASLNLQLSQPEPPYKSVWKRDVRVTSTSPPLRYILIPEVDIPASALWLACNIGFPRQGVEFGMPQISEVTEATTGDVGSLAHPDH